MKKLSLSLSLLFCVILSGCAMQKVVGLAPENLATSASAYPLTIDEGYVYTDNDTAFLSKKRLIDGAKKSIDMSYYIYSDDHSSSVLTKAIIDAARRGKPSALVHRPAGVAQGPVVEQGVAGARIEGDQLVLGLADPGDVRNAADIEHGQRPGKMSAMAACQGAMK